MAAFDLLRRNRLRGATVATVAAGALALAGCADAISGSGSGGNPIISSAPPTTVSSATSGPSTSAPTATPATSGIATVSVPGPSPSLPSSPSSSSSSSSSSSAPSTSTSSGPSGSGCDGADYCDTFSDRSSGWDSTTEKDYTIGYATRGGGSYLVQSRYDGVIYSTAPVDASDIAGDYAMRIDADVAITTPGPDPEVGLRCWGHDASNGGNAGFSGYLSRTTAAITLRTEAGKIIPLKTKAVTAGLPTNGTEVHIALACVQQRTPGGTLEAAIAFAVNGQVVIQTSYTRVPSHYKWNTGKDVGVLLGDKGARGYFDNVGVTHIPS